MISRFYRYEKAGHGSLQNPASDFTPAAAQRHHMDRPLLGVDLVSLGN
jgi:hypothetical protein